MYMDKSNKIRVCRFGNEIVKNGVGGGKSIELK